MDTKTEIKSAAIGLFNRKGVMNVTLRDVAAEMKRGYGNITYYFKTKEVLIDELYEEMVLEYAAIRGNFGAPTNVLVAILNAPFLTFEISLKYYFFYVDFIEIKRAYHGLAHKIDKRNAGSKQYYLQVLKSLQQEGYLRPEFDDLTLDFVMELSGMARTYFFADIENRENKKIQYVKFVNNIIMPYLTSKGMEIYGEFNAQLEPEN